MRRGFVNGVRVAAVGGVVLGCAGCAAVHDDTVAAIHQPRARASDPQVAARAPARKKKAPKDDYLAIQADRNAQNAFGFLRCSLDLWSPFCVQGSVGLYNPKLAEKANLARLFLELDERGSNPLEFYGIGSQVINGGLNIFAYAHTSQSALGSQFFPGITEADVKIEADATSLYFRARPHGDGPWTLLATHAFAGQTAPLLPAVGANTLNDRAEAGFDRFEVVTNGPPGKAQSPAQELARKIWDAVQPQVRALHVVDGAAPDFPAAQAELDAASPLLDAAIAFQPGVDLGSPTVNADVAAALGKARTSLTKARDLATAGKKAADIEKHLKKAIEQAGWAAGTANPETVPP